MQTMHAGLRWSLAATVLLTGLALVWPDDVSHAVVTPDQASWQTVAPPLAPPVPATVGADTPLPERLPQTVLEPASFDPFVGVQALPAPTLKPLAAVAMVQLPEAPPRPEAPVLNYRYLGQFTDPAGVEQVYLANNDAAIAVQVGARLPEGYVVEGIGREGIRLHHPVLDVHVVIAVPAVQDPTTR